jgi:DNA-binding transcriptional LysR family regulator
MLNFTEGKVSLADLEAVVAVFECGHFTRASEMLGRPQPSLSHSVHHVESLARTVLFDRTTRPVALTPESEDFLYELRKGLFFVRRAFDRLKTHARQASGVLEVGHSTYFDPDLLTYLMHVGKTLNAGFQAVYHSSFTAEIVSNILAGVWDCGFVVAPGDTCGLASISILRDPLGILMPSLHPLTRQRAIQLEDIAEETLIAPVRQRNPAFQTWFLERCAATGFAPKIVQEISHPHEAALLVEQRVGLALATKSTAKNAQRGTVVFRPFADPELAVEIQLVMRPGTAPPAF